MAGLTSWTQGAVITNTSAPTMGKVNRYNATAGGLTVTLPALSGLNDGARTLVQKDTLDVSANTITFNRAGSDVFDDGSTSFVLGVGGDARTLQVVTISGTKKWKIIAEMGSPTLDADLTAIAGLTASNDDFLQRKSGAWTNRTVAQVKTDLRRVQDSAAPGATPTINVDLYDQINFTGIAANITSMSTGLTGTPGNGQPLLLRFKDNGTARTIAWGASWRAIGVTLPTTTIANKTMYVGAVRNTTDSIWDVLAVGQEA